MHDEIWIALIGMVGTVLVGLVPIALYLIKRVDRAAGAVTAKNTEEHEMNKAVLERIEGTVNSTAKSVTDHLSWHLSQTTTTPTTVIVHPVKEEAAA
jgi:hypothetical protein